MFKTASPLQTLGDLYYQPTHTFIRNHDGGAHFTFFYASVQYTINLIFIALYYMVVELLDSYKNYFPEPSRDKAFHFHLRNSYLGKFQFGYLQPVKNNEFIL